MDSQPFPTKLIVEEYLADEQLFTHALQLRLDEETPEEIFLINGKPCDMSTWLRNLQGARHDDKANVLRIENSVLGMRRQFA